VSGSPNESNEHQWRRVGRGSIAELQGPSIADRTRDSLAEAIVVHERLRRVAGTRPRVHKTRSGRQVRTRVACRREQAGSRKMPQSVYP